MTDTGSRLMLGRRNFLKSLLAVGASVAGSHAISSPVIAGGKKRFSILHTNDMHSTFVGVGPFKD